MSQTSLPPLYKPASNAFQAPFAYYKPGKAPASFARSANIEQLIADGQLGFQFIPLRESEDDRPTAQQLKFDGAIPLVVAYAIEGFEPSASSNLTLERSGPFRVVNRETGAEVAKGLYTYDELLRQHKVGNVALPAGVKQVRYTYILLDGVVYRLKLNSTLERGIELAVKQVYIAAGSKANKVYTSQLCQDEHFWSLSQLRDKAGKPVFVQVTKEGNRLPQGHSGDVYFMPHLEAKFITDAALIEQVKALRAKIRDSFLQPRPIVNDALNEDGEIATKQVSLPAIEDQAPANDLPF